MGSERYSLERLIFVPIEILEERYSKQWFEWFMSAFVKNGIDPIVVGDQKERTIKTGQFLDVYETNAYKLKQLLQIIHILETHPDDDFTIFFMDAWFAGIETLSYIKNCANRKIKLKGMVHAGTWDNYDFLSQSGCGKWAKPFELSLFKQFDEIFYASDFHLKLIQSYFSEILPCKFSLVRWPVIDPVKNLPKKENIVVFPHRLAPEKNPHFFDALRSVFTADFGSLVPDVRFIKTKDICKTKDDYYDLLSRAKVAVSFANQETFGIAMIEAFHYGCFPVVPDRLSYKETFEFQYRFNTIEEAAVLVYKGLIAENNNFNFKYDSNIDWINKIME